MIEKRVPKEQGLMSALKCIAFLTGQGMLGLGWLATMAGIDALCHRLFDNGVLIGALLGSLCLAAE